MRIGIFTVSQLAVGITFSEEFSSACGKNVCDFLVDISKLLPGKYCLELIMVEEDQNGMLLKHDVLFRDDVMIEIQVPEDNKVFKAYNDSWGFYELPATQIKH